MIENKDVEITILCEDVIIKKVWGYVIPRVNELYINEGIMYGVYSVRWHSDLHSVKIFVAELGKEDE